MKQKLLYICLMILCALAWSGEVWGQTTSYVLNDGNTYDIGYWTNRDGIEFQLSGPPANLSFNIWKTRSATQTTYVYGYDANGNQTTIVSYDAGDLSTSASSKSINISSSIVKIKFIASGTLDKHFSNVKVTRATLLKNFPYSTSTAFDMGSLRYGKSTESSINNITYHNTTYPQALTGTCSMETGTEAGTFSVGTVTASAATGTINIPITFSPKSTGSKSATVTLKLGSTTVATFKVTGTGADRGTPAFTWNVTNAYKNHSYSDFFTSTNTDTGYTITSSNPSLGNVVNGKLVFYDGEGTVRFTVTQTGNVDWHAHEEYFDVNVTTAQNHLPLTITSSNHSTLVRKITGSYTWDSNGIRLGDGGGGLDWDDKLAEINFEGIPDKITFDYEKQASGATGVDWDVRVSTDGNNWSTIWTKTDTGSGSADIPLDASVRYVRLCYSGNFGGYFRNISITERKYLTADKTSLTFGTNTKGNNVAAQTFTISHCNAGYGVTVSSNNANFTVSPTPLTTTGGDLMGTQVITVNYLNNTVGAHTGKITISDPNGSNAAVTLNVSATTQTTYYARAEATHNTGGNAYVSFTSADAATTATATKNSGLVSTNSSTATVYYKAVAAENYAFKGWTLGSENYTDGYKSTNASYSFDVSYDSESSGSPTLTTYKAWFAPLFYFTVTANKIYNHGTVNATVASEVPGDTPDASSVSATATFTASANEGCTFLGWYKDVAHTEPASADDSYKNASFTTTITNESAGSEKNLTLYAYFKSSQTLSWDNATFDKNIIVGSTATGAAKATASSGLTVTYSSSNGSIASVNTNGDVKGELASNDDVTITASQAGNDEYYAATSISRDFHVISKSQATFTVSGLTGTDPTIYVGDTPTITIANTASDFTYTSSDETVVGIEKDGNVITLTALKVGTSTVTLNQPDNSTHSAVSATYNITVSKVANTLGVTLAAASNVQVDGTVNVSFTGINSDADIVAAITDTLSSTANNGEHVISYSNGVITAQNAGVAWITFSQAPTNRYEGFTSTRYKVTVTKHSNPITITLAGGSSTNIKLKYNATATLAYSSAHSTSSITVSHTSGNYSTYDNGTITAGTAQGTDIYAITQPETYKYEAGYASFTIRVNNTDEAVGYVLYDLSEYHHGAGEGTIHKYDLSGPGDVVSYKAWRWLAAIYYDFYVQYSVTGNDNDWHELENNHNVDDSGEPSQDHTCPDTIPEDARYLRFYLPAGGTSRKLVKDVKVTRKTYLRASSNKTAFGTVYTDVSPKPTATITVNYSSVNGGDINISSNNSNFVPSVSKLDVEVNKKDPTNTYVSGVDGTQTFTVTYNPNPNSLGDETAVITISDLFYTQQITLTATAAKHENTLAVIGAQDLMVDDEVSSVYSSKNSTATLNYTLSRDGVITYNPSTNKIKAVGEGNVTLTFSQAENDYYFGASKTVTVNVSKYDQTLSWVNELDGAARTLEVGDHLLTNTATATSGLSVTYSSSNAIALEVNASTGELIAKAGGSNIAITATQVGNYKYNEAVSITRYFTVISRIDAVVTTTLAEDVTNNFPIGNPDITIGCNATITESALTITGNAGGIISSSFANNTFTIRALKEGTVTLTLTRAQDEGYNALNKSYTIQVVKPVVVLDPTVTPVFNYEEYSSVTLNRTLKAGYSTIALPFNTTVEDIVGNSYDEDEDWVAQLSVVAYNAKDGYSLYFEKKSDIVANQPYILHLGSAVDTPVFNNISVVAAATATQYTTKGVKDANQWVLHSNYNPTFDMEGYYGVVGEKIKKGTEGSSLKAFHAYIEGPAAAGVKAAYLDDDEADGLLEVLRGEATSEEDIYDLQGRKLSRSQRGINIIRGADGSFKKVLKK